MDNSSVLTLSGRGARALLKRKAGRSSRIVLMEHHGT
jgi:hypothetical protein